jgi:hypothetical protein
VMTATSIYTIIGISGRGFRRLNTRPGRTGPFI